MNPVMKLGRRALLRYTAVTAAGILSLTGMGMELPVSDPITPTVVGSREFMEIITATRHPATIQIMRHFAWSHLPVDLQSVSKGCADLALLMLSKCPDGPELTAGLRHLLESKDCFVRAALDR